MQTPLQSLNPVEQEQTPAVHVPPVPQSVLAQQAAVVAVHTPLQSFCPVGHWHVPAWQVRPP
jgi:hypothetical protein